MYIYTHTYIYSRATRERPNFKLTFSCYLKLMYITLADSG